MSTIRKQNTTTGCLWKYITFMSNNMKLMVEIRKNGELWGFTTSYEEARRLTRNETAA